MKSTNQKELPEEQLFLDDENSEKSTNNEPEEPEPDPSTNSSTDDIKPLTKKENNPKKMK